MPDSVLDRLARVIRTTLKCPDAVITPTTTADDIDGWDSLTHSVLLMRIEREFAIRFDPAETVNLDNVAALAALVEGKASVPPAAKGQRAL